MPSCGKTSVGKAIAKELNMEFIDSDELIVKKVGMTIPEIFKTQGETGFRKIESDVISEISALQNTVIATGGGAVLNAKNTKPTHSTVSDTARSIMTGTKLYY